MSLLTSNARCPDPAQRHRRGLGLGTAGAAAHDRPQCERRLAGAGLIGHLPHSAVRYQVVSIRPSVEDEALPGDSLGVIGQAPAREFAGACAVSWPGDLASCHGLIPQRCTELRAAETARTTAEARYLDGAVTLFPAVLRAWDEVRTDAEQLAAMAARLAELDGEEPIDPPDDPTEALLTELIADLVEPARVTALEQLGEGAQPGARDPLAAPESAGSKGLARLPFVTVNGLPPNRALTGLLAIEWASTRARRGPSPVSTPRRASDRGLPGALHSPGGHQRRAPHLR